MIQVPTFSSVTSWRPRGHGIECKPEGGLPPYQVSVKREAVHIRASRFKLTETVQVFLRFEAEREASHEAGVPRVFSQNGRTK